MFTIRGKLVIYALEIVVAVLLLTSDPAGSVGWVGIILLGLASIAAGLAMLLGRSIAVAVDELVVATQRIGQGRYDEPVPVHGADEIGALAAAIDQMRLQLRQNVGSLRELNATLERKVEERTQLLQRANERLALLHEMTDAVNSSLDLPLVFQAALSGASRLADFDRAAIARIVDSSTATVFAFSRGATRIDPGREVSLGGSRIDEIVRSGEPRVFEGAGSVFAEGGSRAQVGREAVVPLVCDLRVVGTFHAFRTRSDAFSTDEIQLLTQIGSEVAVAWTRAEAYERERRAALELKAVSDLKSEFVANVSHELRTPLTSILGAADNMLDGIAGELPAKVHAYLDRVRSNATRLLGLINDLLDLSRIEAGKEELRAKRFSLDTVISESLDLLAPIAEQRGIRFRRADSAPLAIVADREKISRVLVNLLQNALKFTSAGGLIEVAASRLETGAVRLTVADDGIGIPKHELRRIFEKFHQVKHAGAPQAQGTGLGLAISRRLAEMHGGSLEVESDIGGGSRFTILLPQPNEAVRPVSVSH